MGSYASPPGKVAWEEAACAERSRCTRRISLAGGAVRGRTLVRGTTLLRAITCASLTSITGAGATIVVEATRMLEEALRTLDAGPRTLADQCRGDIGGGELLATDEMAVPAVKAGL